MGAKANDIAAAIAALQGGANPNTVDEESQRTALHYFAGRGDLTTVSALIGAGARADVKAANGETPVMLAARAAAGAHQIVPVLVKQGADTSSESVQKVIGTVLPARAEIAKPMKCEA